MREVILEACGPHGAWVRIGGVADFEPMGSISSNDPFGRRIYLFGWRDQAPGVWESVAGVDTETSAVLREVSTVGLARLSDLAEPHELEVHLKGHRVRVRFRLN